MALPAQRLFAPRTITSAEALRLARFPAIRREISDALVQQPIRADVTPSYVRYRLKDPGRFHPALFATVRVGSRGSMLVIGTPRATINKPAALAAFLRRMGWTGGRWSRTLSMMERRSLVYQLKQAGIIGGSQTQSVLVPRRRVEAAAGKFMGSARATGTNPLTRKESAELIRAIRGRTRAAKSRTKGTTAIKRAFHAGAATGMARAVVQYGPTLAMRVLRRATQRIPLLYNPDDLVKMKRDRERVLRLMHRSMSPRVFQQLMGEVERLNCGIRRLEGHPVGATRNPQLGGEWCSECGGPLYRTGDLGSARWLKCRFCGAQKSVRITAMKKPVPKFIVHRNPRVKHTDRYYLKVGDKCIASAWGPTGLRWALVDRNRAGVFTGWEAGAVIGILRDSAALRGKDIVMIPAPTAMFRARHPVGNPPTRKESAAILRKARMDIILRVLKSYGPRRLSSVVRSRHKEIKKLEAKARARKTRKNPILATLGIAANPQRGLNIPFRAGQKVKVEAVRKWLASIPDANTRHALTSRFEANIKQYKRFHLGSTPKDFTFQQIPLGTNTRITDVDFVTSEGKEWAASYQVPPHSAKYAKDSQGRYLHAHGDSGIDIKNIKKPANPKILPERFHTADGKFVGVIPKHQKITDWYRF